MTDLTTSTTHAHLRTTPTGPAPRGSAAKDNAICAAILAGAAIAWFGWGQAGHRLGAVLGIGSVLAALVTVAAAIGIGVIWLQERRQEPYAGPTAATAAFFGILLVLAGALTAVRTRQATAGISGSSDWQGSIYGFGWGLGFLAHFALAGALVRAGAPATAMGVQGVVGSLVVVGLMYLFGAAVWGVRPMAVLGAWLLIVAAGAGLAGPVTAALIGAVLGGGGFLAAAGWLTVTRR